jgi:hypothetical protein
MYWLAEVEAETVQRILLSWSFTLEWASDATRLFSLLITNQVRTATGSKSVIPFVPQQAHSSEVILTGHKARTPATSGISRKPVSQLTGFSFFFSRSKRFSNLR